MLGGGTRQDLPPSGASSGARGASDGHGKCPALTLGAVSAGRRTQTELQTSGTPSGRFCCSCAQHALPGTQRCSRESPFLCCSQLQPQPAGPHLALRQQVGFGHKLLLAAALPNALLQLLGQLGRGGRLAALADGVCLQGLLPLITLVGHCSQRGAWARAVRGSCGAGKASRQVARASRKVMGESRRCWAACSCPTGPTAATNRAAHPAALCPCEESQHLHAHALAKAGCFCACAAIVGTPRAGRTAAQLTLVAGGWPVVGVEPSGSYVQHLLLIQLGQVQRPAARGRGRGRSVASVRLPGLLPVDAEGTPWAGGSGPHCQSSRAWAMNEDSAAEGSSAAPATLHVASSCAAPVVPTSQESRSRLGSQAAAEAPSTPGRLT